MSKKLLRAIISTYYTRFFQFIFLEEKIFLHCLLLLSLFGPCRIINRIFLKLRFTISNVRDRLSFSLYVCQKEIRPFINTDLWRSIFQKKIERNRWERSNQSNLIPQVTQVDNRGGLIFNLFFHSRTSDLSFVVLHLKPIKICISYPKTFYKRSLYILNLFYGSFFIEL